jgi:nitrate reductase delta subunit
MVKAMTDDATALQDWFAGTHPSGERAAASRVARSGFVRRTAAQSAALDRVRAWTRERFGLAEDIVVMVAELACALPGCPPVETVVAFWTAPERRHHFKIFKPVAEVVPDDLPPAWLKDALVVPEGGDCDCC